MDHEEYVRRALQSLLYEHPLGIILPINQTELTPEQDREVVAILKIRGYIKVQKLPSGRGKEAELTPDGVAAAQRLRRL